MHTSFTGTARKPRQVNLSGRNNPNPWANLSGPAKPLQSVSGTQNAVAQAQADRVRRQQERDKSNAARNIQKTWRSHASRRIQKQRWRDEWDERETKRLKLSADIQFDDVAEGDFPNQPYPDLNLCLEQMRLLVHFSNCQQQTDTRRLVFFGHALEATLRRFSSIEPDQIWTSVLSRLGILTAKHIEHIASKPSRSEIRLEDVMQLLRLGTYIASKSFYAVPECFTVQFHALGRCLTALEDSSVAQNAIAQYTIALLSETSCLPMSKFSIFAYEMLVGPQVSQIGPLLDFLKQPSQQSLLTQDLISSTQSRWNSSDIHDSKTKNSLWLLAYLTFLRTTTESVHQQDIDNFQYWLQVVSILLSQCANDIAARIDIVDHPMDNAETSRTAPLHPFIREQISTLAQQDSVVQIMDQLRKASSQQGSVSSMAKPLANYAVALLRAFPKRATSIRMWLYRSSPSVVGQQSLSTIQYLWRASERTSIFQKIKNQKNVMSVLVEAAPDHNQIGRAQVSPTEIATWQEDWRIVLLFLELYTFILKLMDDEEFFALDERHASVGLRQGRSHFQQGALPLHEIKNMITFLKNLAFPLYWNAADLDESNEAEELGGLAALFGAAPVEPQRSVEKKKPQMLAGNGVSQAYLKGLVTGLLRTLHERDSRRKFLPEGHWLMTSQFDMQGFIPAVVAEEERRHEYGDDEDEADEQNGDFGDLHDPELGETSAVLPSMNAMFGFRAPHIPRNQASRLTEQMRKRREIAKRKRQSESLAPRLEILRNLPFFIPFDTRVQIFREFVYRDQVRRRNGYIDPDQWRMSVAASTQGRGLDGRPRGLDLIGRHHADIRRESVFEDAYKQFYELGEELKEPIQISFIDKFGATEAGIDGGGVTKEFLMSVTSEAFDPNSKLPMFVENEQRYLYPNPSMFEAAAEMHKRSGHAPGSEKFRTDMRELLRRYEFLGRVIGKCLYEGILVDIVFAGFFLLKWALTGGTTHASTESAYRASINDLRDFDEGLYQGLLTLKNYTGDVESDFGLNFTVTDDLRPFGVEQSVTNNLAPNGANVAVTNANRLAYIDKITRYRLQQQPAFVTNAFLKGLGQIIQPMWLAMFNQRELQKLVGGDNAELDIADLRRNTQYGGVYVIGDDGLEHPTVALFWKVLKEMNDKDRRKVLKFVTSTPRAPLLGFSHLNPKFSIRDSSEDQSRLPSTSTCVNLLKLPRYGDANTMKEKLLYAVNSGAGFDLS